MSGTPEEKVSPQQACTMGPNVLKPTYGPVAPKPEFETYTMSGLISRNMCSSTTSSAWKLQVRQGDPVFARAWEMISDAADCTVDPPSLAPVKQASIKTATDNKAGRTDH